MKPTALKTRIDLNGEWQLAPGTRNGKRVPKRWSFSLPVPGLVDLAEGYEYGKRRYHFYRRVIDLPATPSGTEVDLVLEQSMWTTAVWCNGHAVGESDDCYLPQRFDLTPHLRTGRNEIAVRIGGYDTLPEDHVGGKDHERIEWIPGIWGDAFLHIFRRARIESIQVLPDDDLRGCRLLARIENRSGQRLNATVRAEVAEFKSNAVVQSQSEPVRLQSGKTREVELQLRWNNAKRWSPESPFLYLANVTLIEDDEILDGSSARFGLRKIEIRGNQFYLNGTKRPLRGGNIAFHRFLGDVSRRDLPWNMKWVRRVFATIPKAHHMTFFRAHIGLMYRCWYDIADEEGILLQDEWPFWGVSASMPRVRDAFIKWLRAHGNHPSIILWDPGNECDLSEVGRRAIPAMKKLDPTRPWCHVDTHEEHPYHWSLTPVWPERAMGHARSPEDIRDSDVPAIINEFVWFWLDSKGDTTVLTDMVIERWLGTNVPKKQRLEYQAWLARECIEVWRRLDIAAIQPFVYLSADGGCTANWFDGDLTKAKPKPVLRAVKEALAPLGVSIDLWDRHFFPGERRTIPVHVFNDYPTAKTMRLEFGFASKARRWLNEPDVQQLKLSAATHRVLRIPIEMPTRGDAILLAKCFTEDGQEMGVSEKTIHILPKPVAPTKIRKLRVAMIDPRGEMHDWTERQGLSTGQPTPESLSGYQVLWLGEGALQSKEFVDIQPKLRTFVRSGGLLIVQEPEFERDNQEEIEFFPGTKIVAGPRNDVDKGGYDAVVHPTAECPQELLHGLKPKHLSYFSGGTPGMVVSEGVAEITGRGEVWMRCGIRLKIPALSAKRIGDGVVIVNRVQLRGRLLGEKTGSWPRRPDPVAQKLALNLLAFAGRQTR
ncbi:hypothetical protein KQI84_17185 [bacterium]|nr:hypothetical protein [bacterium]